MLALQMAGPGGNGRRRAGRKARSAVVPAGLVVESAGGHSSRRFGRVDRARRGYWHLAS